MTTIDPRPDAGPGSAFPGDAGAHDTAGAAGAAGAAAVAVTVFHRPSDAAAFVAWTEQLRARAAVQPGFRSFQVVSPAEPEFDWAVLSGFGSVTELDAWLDSPERRELIRVGRGQGAHRAATEMVLRGKEPPGGGTGAIEHLVEAGHEDEFVAAQQRLVQLSASFPGFDGAAVVPTGDVDENGRTRWWSVLRFRTPSELDGWMRSAERAEALPALRSALGEDFTDLSASTPFGSIVRVHDGQARATPNWKSAMMVLLVLYPTVMLLSRFVGPVFTSWGVPQWLSMWLSQILSVGLMTWFLMPWVTGWFRRWLDPVDGAGRRVSLTGAVVAATVMAVCLAVFGTVTWLQFWRY
jgi:uncharacterized protein